MSEYSQEWLIETLHDTGDVKKQRALVDRLLEAGEYGELLALAGALAAAQDGNRNYQHLLSDITRMAALKPGAASADLAVTIGTLLLHYGTRAARQNLQSRPGDLPSMLAFVQPLAVISGLFSSYGGDERCSLLLLDLAQEMVARGKDVSQMPAVVDFYSRMGETGHPLAGLPLALTSLERRFPDQMVFYKSKTSGRFDPIQPEFAAAPFSGHDPVRVANITTADDVERIGAAFNSWLRESNGKMQVSVFELNPPLAAGRLSVELLLGLNLRSLSDVEVGSIEAHTYTAADALTSLFSSALHGGAYGGAKPAGEARLEAWASLAALIGADKIEVGEELAEQARQASWLRFYTAAGPFFHAIAWDVGLAALRPDGRVLAVVEATDED